MKRTVFLLLLALLCAALALGQRIAVLSDVHVTPGNACDAALRQAVDEINASGFDLVVMNGDLTNEGSDEQLAHVKAVLDGISHPLRVLPGNHENNWSQSATKTFVNLWGADRFALVLDSLVVVGTNCGPYMKMGDGHVKQEDLHWLGHTLDSLCAPGRRVLSFNHYPLREGDLDNYADYAAALAPYPVIGHVNGHYHSWMRYDVAGLECVMTRALSMGGDNYGYSIVEVSPEWVMVYDKQLGREPEPKFAFPARPAISADAAAALLAPADWEAPEGWEVSKVWADPASVFTRLGFDADRVYFGNSLGEAKAVGKRSGRLEWSAPLGASLFSRPVALPKGRVALPHAGGIAIADASAGRIVKELPSREGPYVADGLVAPDGKAYLQGGYKRLECRDASTDKLRWTLDSLGNYCQGAPAIDGDDIVFGAWDTYLRCVDLRTGRLRWKWSNGKEANMLGPGNVVPAICGDKVIIVAPDRYMTAIDRATGETLWRDNSHRYRESLGRSADGSTVYAKTMDGELVAIDATASAFSELWTVDMGLGYDHAPCPIAEAGGLVLAGSRRGIVTAVDPAARAVAWQLTLGSSEINAIDIDPTDATAWVSLIEGTIYRLRPKE